MKPSPARHRDRQSAWQFQAVPRAGRGGAQLGVKSLPQSQVVASPNGPRVFVTGASTGYGGVVSYATLAYQA